MKNFQLSKKKKKKFLKKYKFKRKTVKSFKNLLQGKKNWEYEPPCYLLF
jgi:hypothetical protein